MNDRPPRPVKTLVCLLSIVAVGLAGPTTGAAARARSYRLAAHWAVGQTQHVKAQLQVGGDLKLATDDQIRRVPMSVTANVDYSEKLLDVVAGSATPERSARYFDRTEATVRVANNQMRPALRNDMRSVIALLKGGRTTMFSPRGPLTRDELDLISLPADSLAIERLLPDRPVAVGQTWNHSAAVIKALLGLDAVSQCDATSLLEKVTDTQARIALAGTVRGAVDGVETHLELKAAYLLDRRRHRVTRFEIAVKEDRAIGHVGPGLDVVAKLKMRITPTNAAARLNAVSFPAGSTEGQADQLRLLYESRRGGFRLLCDRRWYVTTDAPRLTVLRFVDRGQLVAQCRVSPLSNKTPERRISLDTYQKDVRYALGEHLGQIVQATEWTDGSGSRVYRVRARGQVKELPIEWRYYLVTVESGRRVALAFTVETSLTQRFGDADRSLVQSITLIPPAATRGLETAQRQAADAN